MVAVVQGSTWAAVIALASLSIGSTAIGVALARWAGARPAAQAAGIGFSVGVMVTISAAELLPEAHEQAGLLTTGLAVLAGAGIVAVLHVIVPHVHLVDEDRGVGAGSLRAAYLVAFGLILHDLPEGFAMATAYIATPRLGVLVAIAIVLHNIPEEFTIALPAVMTGRRRFLIRAAVISAAAEPAGALAGLAGVSVFPGLNAGFLAFAAGAMLFVSFHELIPMARRLGRHCHTAAGIAGGALTLAVLQRLISA